MTEGRAKMWFLTRFRDSSKTITASEQTNIYETFLTGIR